MRRAPQIIGCLLLWMLGGLACDVIPITIPLDDGAKSMPETGSMADAGGIDIHEWASDGVQDTNGVPPPWKDAGTSLGDGALDGWFGDGWSGDGWPGDGWPGDGWPGDGGGDATVGDSLLLDGGPTPDGLLGLDGGDSGSGDSE